MSRKGDCWDNAVAESFFQLLKTEVTYHCRWLNYQAAYRSLFEYKESLHPVLRITRPIRAAHIHNRRLRVSVFSGGVSLSLKATRDIVGM